MDVWKCGCDELLERYGIKEGSRIRVLGRVLDGLIIGNGKVRLALGDEVAERIQV
ncbi:MAG: ferrous iron transport protein A [Clostridium fessum]